ncbi:sensor histidine kinase [Humibacillus xanthopallidus]|uniref:histidine kinase n=1 Tax=Humibacillus xanthopallidus TaxID=412689 RepID=A0A543I1U8_9MICO|nr:ATP-binding protein [Humibacillus xanthopallidus]TQM64535.1 histidine kinase/DNA gyrase B/HSP90-like ATPase [Humibacillus xanthopallidus]
MNIEDRVSEPKIFEELPAIGESEPFGAQAHGETVRTLCHDMRQHLMALRLLAHDAGGEGDDALMATVLGEVNWLAALVESVLGGHEDTGPSVVDLGDVVADAAGLGFAGVRCVQSIDIQGAAWAKVRQSALKRAVLCVLDNAIRAAGDEGHVAVILSTHEGRARIVVADDGPGLGRLAPQHSLGLPTVRAVLADCDGSFSLENGSNGGAVATMEIPLVAWLVGS